MPQFRAVTWLGKAPEIAGTATVRLVADADFAPFSFTSQDGTAAGLAVDLALGACAEMKLSCEVQLLPFADLLPALAEHRADAILAGPRIDAGTLADAAATRPYFRTLARFAVPAGSTLAAADAEDLSGTRIAVAKGSTHEAWLRQYYRFSRITAYDTEAAAQEALKAGQADALFGDNLHVIYWVAGDASAGCCKVLDHAFSDLDAYSRNLSFFVRSDRPDLTAAFDYGLDRLQATGTTDKIFNRYIPLNPW